MPGAFEGLEPHSYDLIMADPPWTFKTYSPKGEGKSPQAHYECMTEADIACLPVQWLAAPDSILFLWATWPMLDRGLTIMHHWQFTYKTGGVWHKRTKNGKTAFGTGFRVRSACEPFMIGTRGNPKTSRAERNLIEGLAREHSRKPEEAYTWCERYMPDARRLDLFSRQARPGWTAWGREAGKYNGEAA